MSQREWLDAYVGQSTKQLLALEESHRIDSLVLAFEQGIRLKWERVGGEELSDAEWTVLAIEAMEREVNNGGFAQFFTNSSRELAPLLIPSLQAIDCLKTAAIVQRARDVVDRSPILDSEIEDGTWQDNVERNDALEACDSEYFGNPENIEERLFQFIKANDDDIQIP